MFEKHDSIVASRTAQLSADLDGEFVILSVHDGTYYGLDGTGARVWELIQDPRSVGFLVDTISGEYLVDAETCEKDLQKFLQDLADRSFIDVTPAAVK